MARARRREGITEDEHRVLHSELEEAGAIGGAVGGGRGGGAGAGSADAVVAARAPGSRPGSSPEPNPRRTIGQPVAVTGVRPRSARAALPVDALSPPARISVRARW